MRYPLTRLRRLLTARRPRGGIVQRIEATSRVGRAV
jgi:hypothetical protein